MDSVWRFDVNTMPWPAGRYTGWMSSSPVDDVMRRNVPPVRPPVVMSYSQMFQWPVQAATPPMVTAFALGQRIENRIFLPSHDTSGVDASPWPSVNCAVMLCSGALGDDFSRIIRSPPGAVGAPLVGFRPIVLTRLAYAMGTSPCTVTVLESDFEPPRQALSDRMPTAASAPALPSRARVENVIGSFMRGLPWCSCRPLSPGGRWSSAVRPAHPRSLHRCPHGPRRSAVLLRRPARRPSSRRLRSSGRRRQ